MPALKTTYRVDPYKNFKFRVRVDGRQVAGVSKVNMSAVKRAEFYEAAGKNQDKRSAEQTKFEPITLERGVTYNPDFANWANKMNGTRSRSGSKLKDIRKDITIQLYDEAGKLTASYKLTNAWVSKIESVELNAKANEVAIETIELEHEGIDTTK